MGTRGPGAKPRAGSGNPTLAALGRRQSGPRARPARMRNVTRSPGPGRDVNPDRRRRPRPRARACAAGPWPAAGWDGAVPSPRSGCAPGRAQGEAFAPGGPSAPAAHTQPYLCATSAPLPAVEAARPPPGTADARRLPLSGLARRRAALKFSETRGEARGGEESSRERGEGWGTEKGRGCAPLPSSAQTGDPRLQPGVFWGPRALPSIVS